MCGIVGLTGQRAAEPILLEGLSRLEYRGYDRADLTTLSSHSRRSVAACYQWDGNARLAEQHGNCRR